LIEQGKPQTTKRCVAKDEDRCVNIFYITEGKFNNVHKVEALSSKLRDCPSPIDITKLIVGIVAGIFGVGLFLLIMWLAIIQFAAYREYKAFLKEQAQASWNQVWHLSLCLFCFVCRRWLFYLPKHGEDLDVICRGISE
jgi:hypothetical protein